MVKNPTYFHYFFFLVNHLKLPWDKWTTLRFGHLSLQVKLHFKRSEKPKPLTHFSRLNTQLNDLLMDRFAVSIYFTLYISWNIYTVTWVNICSCLSLWLTVQVTCLDVNCWTCHEMTFAFTVPKAGMILWSDCQSVMDKVVLAAHANHQLCPDPTVHTLGPDAYKSAPVKLVWP